MPKTKKSILSRVKPLVFANAEGDAPYVLPSRVASDGTVESIFGGSMSYTTGEIALNALNDSVTLPIKNNGGNISISLRSVLALSATFTFYVSTDGGLTFQNQYFYRQNNAAAVLAITLGGSNLLNFYTAAFLGITHVKVVCTAWTSGLLYAKITATETLNQTEISANIGGTVVFLGQATHGAGLNNSVLNIAHESRVTNRTATTDGQVSKPIVDKLGRQVVRVGNIREMTDNNAVTLTTTTETTIAAAVAAVNQDVVGIIISNTSATGVRVDIRDSAAGTVRLSVWAQPNSADVYGLPIKQAAINTAWTAQLSAAVTDVRVCIVTERVS